MRYTVILVAALALGGLFWAPRASAQNSKEYKAIQLEFYDVNKALADIKTGQDERIGQLETLIKQLMDANSKLTEQVQLLQTKVTDTAAQQDRRIIAPLDEIKKGVAELWEAQQATKGSIDGVRSRQETMEKSLTDLTGAIGLFREEINTRVAPPPSAPASADPGQAGVTGDPATLAFATAEQDKLAGKLQQALEEFRSIADAYPSSPQAPMAIFEVGMIYANYPQPEDAIKAFDRVLEQFGDNPMRKPAHFAKAEQLEALGKRTEAAREFNSYAKQYPDDDNAEIAKQRAAQLTSPAAAKPKSAPKGKRK